jgi:hypothetical protein
MTKEQKILLLFVLIIAGTGATYYFTQSNQIQAVAQTQSQTQTSVPDTTGGTQVTGTVTTGGVQTTGTVGVTTGTAKKLTDKVSYDVPEGHTEALTVNVTLDASGKITDVTFAFDAATNHDSGQYQNKFTSSFKASTLVGTKLGDVKLSRVGGASLATAAFNHALSDLTSKANG